MKQNYLVELLPAAGWDPKRSGGIFRVISASRQADSSPLAARRE